MNVLGRLEFGKPSPKEGEYLNLANTSSEEDGGFCSATYRREVSDGENKIEDINSTSR